MPSHTISRIMSIKPEYFEHAEKNAIIQRQVFGKNTRWQDVIRQALKVGLPHTDYAGRICPVFHDHADCPIHLVKNCDVCDGEPFEKYRRK